MTLLPLRKGRVQIVAIPRNVNVMLGHAGCRLSKTLANRLSLGAGLGQVRGQGVAAAIELYVVWQANLFSQPPDSQIECGSSPLSATRIQEHESARSGLVFLDPEQQLDRCCGKGDDSRGPVFACAHRFVNAQNGDSIVEIDEVPFERRHLMRPGS